MPTDIDSIESINQHVSHLLRVIGRCDIPLDYERSFQIAEGRLSTNRFLLSSSKGDYGESPIPAILRVCRSLGMPQEYLATIGFHLPAAENIHYGFEQGASGSVYKVYIEFAKGVRLTIRPDGSSEPVLLYLAYKWPVSKHTTGVVTRYTWHPLNSAEEILSMVTDVYQGGRSNESFQITQQLLSLASAKLPPSDIQYLEVREDATRRRSFDLNFYDAGLQVKDIFPLLNRMCKYHSVSRGKFQGLYDMIKCQRFGHLSSGTHRDGAGYFNVYYGACIGDGYHKAMNDAQTMVESADQGNRA